MRTGLIFAFAFAFALAAASGFFLWSQPPVRPEPPVLVRIPAGSYRYRPGGEFRIGTRVLDPPLQEMNAAADLYMMKFKVSEADYARCAAARACPDLGGGASVDFAQTGVNHDDAAAYARWLSDRTGQDWRLPTDAEWLRAAGVLVVDDGLPAAANGEDPAGRWLASYRREVAARGAPDPRRHPNGQGAASAFGVADMTGNVWEWTETCFRRGTLSPDGANISRSTDYCGVRAVQGKHRAFVTDFVRDARSGGCAAGVPPDFLGFRLVRGG